MVRNDGDYVIYIIEMQYQKQKDWFYAGDAGSSKRPRLFNRHGLSRKTADKMNF